MSVLSGNPVIEALLTRRSIRAYTIKAVEQEALRTILSCGLHAPSGHNRQLVRLMVMQDDAVLGMLEILVRKELAKLTPIPGTVMESSILNARKSDYHFLHGARVLINAAAPRDYENAMAECAATVENMLIAAQAIGLAGCWVNQPHWLTGNSVIRPYFSKVGLRDNEDIFASLVIGYPAVAIPPAPPRCNGRICGN